MSQTGIVNNTGNVVYTTELTTSEAKSSTSYQSWDFDTVWFIDENETINNGTTENVCRLVNGYQLVQQLPLGKTQPQAAKGDRNTVTIYDSLYNGLAYEIILDTTSDFELVDWGGVLVEISGNPYYKNIHKIRVNN